ncbi:hypothetical protein [Pelomonas sp. KK5]|uniref:hypothetical protein n=1 Tax=Pelomonas sp. KK5 TaxID=1855730 RepID=UPI00097C97F3|nr:hypothetical protein [Pelomonas sp. KK5]
MSNDEDFFALPPFKPAEALVKLKRDLRDLRSLTERSGGGSFDMQGQPVLQLSSDDTQLHARLAKRPARSPEWESRSCKNAAEVRRLLDDIRRRVAQWTDDTP